MEEERKDALEVEEEAQEKAEKSTEAQSGRGMMACSLAASG